MILTRSPLETITMNGAGTQKRRSARLSAEGVEDGSEQPPQKKTKVGGQAVSTKTTDGGSAPTARPGRKAKKGEFGPCAAL